MSFIPFQKIFDSTKEWNCERRELIYLENKVEFIALEKVDGANLPVVSHGQEVLYGKRKSFLKPDDWFYNYQTIQEDITSKTLALKQLCIKSKQWPHMTDLILYGELCGGWYPIDSQTWSGPIQAKRIDQERHCLIAQEYRAVQEGIYYSSKIEYIALDLLIISDQVPHLQGINYDLFVQLCNQVGLHCLPKLNQGSLLQCLNTPSQFDSKIGYTHFGQKQLPPGTNQAEGIVIRPLDGNITLSSNQTPKSILMGLAFVRPMIKIKHHLEMSSQFIMPDITTDMLLSQMVVPVRLSAVLSKYGKCDTENHQEVSRLLADDIWDDYWLKHSHINVRNYNESDNKLILKCQQLVDRHIQNANSGL